MKVAVVLGVLDEDVLLHPGDDFEGFEIPKFGFCLKNWPIDMCIVLGCLTSHNIEGGGQGSYMTPTCLE